MTDKTYTVGGETYRAGPAKKLCPAYIYFGYDDEGHECELDLGHAGPHQVTFDEHGRKGTITWEEEPEPEEPELEPELTPEGQVIPRVWSSAIFDRFLPEVPERRFEGTKPRQGDTVHYRALLPIEPRQQQDVIAFEQITDTPILTRYNLREQHDENPDS